ncbi:hypothetical protein K437DRAFT_259077 [Tilletiaria anomala UBC 951]|uniref:Uncharacterized protein n=1 Tax=Tilletiaria anomala (strain ATCC 24038 / CBS 436.72 / UBC 951) TaxID=1037660 RepID=A0A066VCE2_TILAU|nr:uncharacterized protein K437DRAFT_259077 [Tilletiaria anomala UBC 951]KDN39387.1 hypothetical protein K437DRAFT_259077 [Tilletiaria anomala UBC 951]
MISFYLPKWHKAVGVNRRTITPAYDHLLLNLNALCPKMTGSKVLGVFRSSDPVDQLLARLETAVSHASAGGRLRPAMASSNRHATIARSDIPVSRARDGCYLSDIDQFTFAAGSALSRGSKSEAGRLIRHYSRQALAASAR